MIPRFRPSLGLQEFLVLFKKNTGAVETFEKRFAQAFGAKSAVAFPYGRSAQWAYFKALDISNGEIVMPAYTCSVVAHAVTLSGNKPRFVDVSRDTFNMDLKQLSQKINENTKGIIATHTFGYPQNIDKIMEIAGLAEKKYGTKIKVIQDCCHAFSAKWGDRFVGECGDVAIYAFNISKTMTSIFGGMLTFQDEKTAEQVRKWRDKNFKKPSILKSLKRRIYLLLVFAAFSKRLYYLTWWLQHKSKFLDYATKAYHRDGIIHFPPDFDQAMTDVEAAVGLVQLSKYPSLLAARREKAINYSENLRGKDWKLPPIVDGATYSHYTVLIENRAEVIEEYASKGVELGELIQYSIPDLPEYVGLDDNCPIARELASKATNFPVSM